MFSRIVPKSTVIFLILISVFAANCGGKKKKAFWPLALMGGGSGTGSSSSTATDSNGVPLPASTAPTGSTSQEVPTSGSAQVTGSIEVDSGGANVNTDNDPSNDIDLSTIQVQLVAPDGTVVATTNMNALGEYIFNVPDLSNDTYRVLINSGLGVNYAYQDFNFTFNPTAGPSTPVSIPTMQAERLFYTSGAAEISGVVNTPGYNNLVSVPAGGLAGVTVQLVDKDGNVAATRTTDSSGNYSFSLVNLPNGNYFIVVLGSSISQNSRSFVDQTIPVRFTFEGNNPVVATVLSVSDASLAWDAASSSAGQISGTVSNAAIPSGDTSVSFTVTLKDASGDIIASTSPDSSGNYSFNQSLSNGVYYVEVTRTNFLTATVSFLFASHPSGGSNVKNISVAAINVVPRPSNISGTVTDGVITPVPGAVINFRPDKTMTPVQLAYMLAGSDDRLRNLAGMWIREVCPAWNGTAPGIAQCIGTTAGKCNGTSAAYCNYQTYQNKVYEVSGSNVVFAAAAGIWQYYISAPGYSSSSTSSITLNGSDITASSILMSPSTHRTQIAGSAIVLDNLVNGTKKAYQGAIPGYTNASTSLPGLFVVILGNNDTAGNPVAHITITNGTGAFVFDGNSKVISLPSLLANDTQRVGYAIQNFASAVTLSSAGSVSGSSTGDSVQIVAGNFQFKQGSYAVVIVDPLGHLSASSTRADNNPGATSLYAVNSVNAMVLHLPRRKVSGNVSNAITTDSLNGAAVALGRDSNPDPNVVDFNANVTKDYDTISGASRFAAGSDQLVAAVATDAAGNYSIDNIDPGEYVLKITKAGYGDSYIPVSVSSIANNVVNSQLIENAGTGNLSGFVKLPGGFSFTGTYSLELVNPTSGMRPTSGIQPSSLSSGATTFSNVPKYDVFQINAGQWKLRFVAPGYKSVEGIVNIQKDTSTNFDIITMVPGSNGPATVSGRALNALNNSGIPNLSVRLRPGINVTSGAYATDINGAVIAAVSTASDGSFAIPGVPPGNYSLEVAGTNFSTTYRTVISAGTDTPSNQNILVSPILVNNEMRIVLSWNAIPRDLDSHLEFGNSSCVSGGKKCQVVWNDKNKLGGDLKLDYDITTGHGPETVTITGSAWTQPRLGYSIYNWSNEAAMSTSGAVIRVFKSQGLVRTYSIGANQVGRWWQIFCLNPSMSIIDTGQTGCNVNDYLNVPFN